MDIEQVIISDDDFEDELNEIWGDINVCGQMHGAGSVLREIDPIAFDTALADKPVEWKCGNCGSKYEDEDEAESCCKEE